MKYIKSYEAKKYGKIKTDFEDLKFNDFIAAYRPIGTEAISNITIISNNNNGILLNKLVLDIGKIESEKSVNNGYYGVRCTNGSYYYIKPQYIIFASDRKKDVIDYIKTLINANKYNL